MSRLAFAILASIAMTPMASAQPYYGQQPSAFWNSYYAAQNGFNQGMMAQSLASNRRNTEAIVNEMRAQRGLPPCSIGLLGQWAGRPAC
jgi:hypothetical protein